MPAGAPKGNDNGQRGYRYRKALERALAHKYGSVDDGLLEVAKLRLDKATEGDTAALEHIADRFDGKPAQAVDLDVSGGLKIVAVQPDVG